MTIQIKDRLKYENKNYSIAELPMQAYFYKNKIEIRFIFKSTDCWRGYTAMWEINGGKLFLTNLKGEGFLLDRIKYQEERLKLRKKIKSGIVSALDYQKSTKILKNECFTKVHFSLKTFFKTEDMIFAEWYSGILTAHNSKLKEKRSLGNEKKYENELLFKIRNGQVL
ncbi:MAG: hypothetical protein ACOYLE_06935 [Bacteroidales bacterium]